MEKQKIFEPSLGIQRKYFIAETLRKNKIKSVLEIGCGEGKVLKYLKEDEYPILDGVDINQDSLQVAIENLQPSFYDFFQKKKIIITFYQENFLEIKSKWKHYDCIILTEVIEHINEDQVDQFSEIIKIFEPKIVIITTPNSGFNKLLKVEKFRDLDHKFEWNREQFKDYINRNWEHSDYSIEITGVGILNQTFDESIGFASQIAVLSRELPPSSKKLISKSPYAIIRY